VARKFLTHIDLNKLELQNAAIQNLASAPSDPVTGQIYFDTVLGYLRTYDGTTWINASEGAQGIQGIQGANGNDGAQGAAGNDGAQGANGNDGAQGTQGIQGIAGNDGAQGAQGYNAGILGVNTDFVIDGSSNLTLNYSNVESQLSTDGFFKSGDSTVNVGGSGDFTVTASNNIVLNPASGDHAYVGSVSSDNQIATILDINNAMLQGVQGAQGANGNDGAQGTQGIQGAAGNDGAQGAAGENGNDGAQGAQGAQGENAGILSVNGPLSVDVHGALSLSYGGGLGLSGSDLVANTDNTLTIAAGTGNQLGVSYGSGLTTDGDGKLIVNQDTIASKNYVDAVAQGLNVKSSVAAASTANVNLANVDLGSPSQTLDGTFVGVGNRVLIKNQDTSSENGIYVINYSEGVFNLTRATDEATPAKGDFVFVENGDTNGKTGWILSDVEPLAGVYTWTQFSAAGEYTAGTNISLSGNTISVIDAPTFNNPTLTVGSAPVELLKVGSSVLVNSDPDVTILNAATSSLTLAASNGLVGNSVHIVDTSNSVDYTGSITASSVDGTTVHFTVDSVINAGVAMLATALTYSFITVGSLTTVSSTEISYLDGVTSNIQTQLNSKVRKYSATITGDASTTSFALTHGLGSADAEISVYDSTGAKVETDVTITSTTATIGFVVAPASGVTYRVVVTA